MRQHLPEHSVATVYEQGWSDWSNGDLLQAAEEAGYSLFVTTDQNLRYQQNLHERKIAIVVLLSTSWPRIRLHVDDIREIINGMGSGGYIEIPIDAKSA